MSEKDKAIEGAIAKLNKKYGNDSVMRMDKSIDIEVKSFPTGCLTLDEALGCGGLPRGRIIEVFGEESSGKSTLSLFFMAQIQKAGGKAALIDAEFAFDANYARAIGVDTDKLILAQPSTLEEAMEITRGLVESNGVDIIVVDSVASLVPKKELEGDDMLKDSIAEQARLMSKALRILSGAVSRSDTILIFINQLREKVGVFYGKKENTTGGKALKFYASIRIDVKKGDKIENEEKIQIGNWMKVNMVKNKVGYPWRMAEFELFYGAGIDLEGNTLDYAEKKGIVKRAGSSYNFNDKKLGVGRENAKKYLKQHQDVYAALVKAIKDYEKK
jgi:recombination protein RecA